MITLREFKIEIEGWSGVLKYRPLSPFDKIRAGKVIAAQDLEKIQEVEAKKAATGKTVLAPEHFDFLEAGLKFGLPFIEEVDATDPDGVHWVDAQAFMDDGDNLEVLTTFAMQMVTSALSGKKKPIAEVKKPGKSSKIKPAP
jgi:hypothetical protein